MIPETMDALVKPNREKGLVLERRPVPSPGMGEVLIRIHKPRSAERMFIFTTGIPGAKRISYRP